MSPLAPTLILLACVAGAFGAWLIAAPRFLFSRPEDPAGYHPHTVELGTEGARWSRFVLGPSLIGLALACAGIAAFGLPASDEGRIALCVAVALAPLPVPLALPAARPRTPLEWASLLSWGAYLGAVVYSFMVRETLIHGFQFMDFLLLAGTLTGTVAAVRALIVHWRDEAYLVDNYDSAQGYIEQPRRLSIRTKAVLSEALGVAILVFLIFYFTYRLFSPE
jgi:hypothetical protein